MLLEFWLIYIPIAPDTLQSLYNTPSYNTELDIRLSCYGA